MREAELVTEGARKAMDRLELNHCYLLVTFKEFENLCYSQTDENEAEMDVAEAIVGAESLTVIEGKVGCGKA